MISLADNTIDDLIRRVRRVRSMENYVFAAEYPPRETPHPIERYVVTPVNTEMRIKRRFVGDRIAPDRTGTLFQAGLLLRVYAPEKSVGSALLRATSLLADAVEAADEDRIVQDIAFSCIHYDPTVHTVYRDLTVTLWLALSGEAQDD